MSDRYNNFRGESAFKSAVTHKQNSNSNLAWYEEVKDSFPIINTSHLWADYDSLPPTPIENLVEYKVVSGAVEVPIYKKYEVNLEPTENRNIFYNENLNQVIDKVGYDVSLYTQKGEEVPFGLGKWVYDNECHLIFLDGLPEGWGNEFKIIFYRYEGRILDDVILKNDGSTQMVNSYVPKLSQDIATKSYIDDRTGNVMDELKKLLPKEPQNELNGKSLESSYRLKNIYTNKEVTPFSANYVRNGTTFSKVVFNDTKIEIFSPLIYLRDSGILSLTVVVNDLPTVYSYNFETGENDFTGDPIISPYYKDVNSTDFYKGIIVRKELELNNSIVGNRFYKFTFSLTNLPKGENNQYSGSLVLGVDPLPKTEGVFDKDIAFWMYKPEEDKRRWVSGVPHFVAGTKIPYKGITAHPLNSFYDKEFMIGKSLFFDENDREVYSKQYMPSTTGWGIYENPLLDFKDNLIIPNEFYSEKLNIEMSTFDIHCHKNGEWKKSYGFLIDTLSNEDRRVVSKDYIDIDSKESVQERDKWNPSHSLLENQELLLLGNQYQYPTQNFNEMAGVENIFKDWNDSWIKFPDYSKCHGPRYATFMYTLPTYETGITVEIPGLKLVSDLKTFEANEVEIYVEDRGWLNGKKPYPGFGAPVKTGDPCLVVANGYDNVNYFTFGYKPYKGVIYIRIGLNELQKDIKFKAPIVKEALPL